MNERYAKAALPDGYQECEKIDLVKNRKQMLLVNGLSILLMLAVIGLGILIQPKGAEVIFDFEHNAMAIALKCLVICLGAIVYIVGHEAVHGVFMWYYSRIRPCFGFSFSYAYAGSDIYFFKKPYLVIAIAPLAVWTALLCACLLLVPAGWFWVVWFIQIANISGAAGDLYVFFRMLQKPQNTLVQDTGTAMTVYLPAA